MNIIDTHQHFWSYDPNRHQWIDDSMVIIQRDFLPMDLAPVLQENGVSGCITVQVDQTEDETRWMLSLAEKNAFIKGVVGWVNLCSERVEERLEHFSKVPLLKGFRHILQSEEPEFMLQPHFQRGIKLLSKYNFTYDILVYPNHLDAVLKLVNSFPDQPFIIDHLAKPRIVTSEISEWKKKIHAISKHENVHCKVSGMVTEADWKAWNSGQLEPYLDAVVECFGMDRLFFGSDWPVCLVASSYAKWLQTVKNYFSQFSPGEQKKFFSLNAERFYRLS